ncbi:MAG: hypothetical protein R2867_19310 [Caldilineaceae bacterium]
MVHHLKIKVFIFVAFIEHCHLTVRITRQEGFIRERVKPMILPDDFAPGNHRNFHHLADSERQDGLCAQVVKKLSVSRRN